MTDVFDYTELKPFITRTVLDIAAARFAHRFSEQAVRLYLEKDPVKRRKKPLTIQMLQMLEDAMENERGSAEIWTDGDTVRKIEDHVARDDTGAPILQFHVNGDMLFVCCENHDHLNQDGDPAPQLSAIALIPIRDGKPDLRVLPRPRPRPRNTYRAPQYGRKGGGR